MPRGVLHSNRDVERGKAGRMSEWIPVTERTPDTYNEVLVTIIVKDGEKEKRHVGTAGWFSDGMGGGDWLSVWDEYRIAGMRTKVVAWMPMPKPYEG